MAVPQATVVAGGHAGQHEPPVQLLPAGHRVPVPHERHTLPSVACTSGTAVPQATVALLGQSPQHSRSSGSVVPGGVTHVVPVAHIEPTPVHVRQVDIGMGVPQAMFSGAVHAAQHTPAAPPVHDVPEPHPPVP